MKRFLATALLIALPTWLQAALAAEDAAFTAAREAYARKDRASLAVALASLGTHPLAPWARYFQLSLQLADGKNPSDEGVAEFVEREAGTWLGEKMRAEWLKWLVDRQEWQRAREQFARLQRPDAESLCRGLEARLQLGEAGAANDVAAILAAPQPLAASCLPPLGRLAATGELPTELLWERLFRQWAGGRLKEARVLASWLSADEAPAPRSLDNIAEHPVQVLANKKSGTLADPKKSGVLAEAKKSGVLAALAVLRMARTDVHLAAARWQEVEERLPAGLRGIVWGRLALVAALTHQPEATEWFNHAEKLGASFDEEQQGWRIRAGLRAGDWPEVARSTAALPETLASRPEWLYWRARALAALGWLDDAQALYRQIAGQPHFYGILASEALGRRLSLPPRAQPPSPEERREAESHPTLIRALALIRAGLRNEGVREWNWVLADMDDRQLLAAADFARQNEVIDRAISTAERTRSEHDFALRYPTPFFEQVAPRVREVDLDPAWVYGLMRQESRFVMDAKSSAGAKGLMQLMPATAKWVAKKIGLTSYHPGKVTEMDTNLTLGTNYLRMVMDSLDDHPVLATAAYNAGPGRARKWRAERPLEGAIYVETIPFSETRDYVKKVMANAIYYAALMGRPAPSLTQRLGTIRPRGFGDIDAERLP
ncbi:lytic transglycosylase domain-containing protein [Sulfuricystis multivorans]|uniref:lytic transglycosylase domain-containing protein n=1 Tax=Sulfuricystis multivorans TaxID=2211108 RepID=UPI0015587CFD|nr:lytic transglycosylase domain-containing protein [Sulfuricystis multivorans]